MIDLAPVFLRNSATGLVTEQAADGGFKSWIIQGTYSLALGSLGGLTLTGITASSFFPYLFADYARFAMASKESVHLSFGGSFDKRATAWALINRYYSAFFAAHALLRAHGKGVTWIDPEEAFHLEQIGRIYIGPNFRVKRGGYSFEFNSGNGFNAEVKLGPISYGGGSHDDFWRFFVNYLTDFGSQLLGAGVPYSALAIARFDEMRRIILSPTGRGVWLSFMRNEINYQHKLGTWFPFKPATIGSTHDRRILQQSNSSIDLTADAARQPLKAFNAVTCCMASLNSDFATLLKDRAGVGAARFRNEWNRLQVALNA